MSPNVTCSNRFDHSQARRNQKPALPAVFGSDSTPDSCIFASENLSGSQYLKCFKNFPLNDYYFIHSHFL